MSLARAALAAMSLWLFQTLAPLFPRLNGWSIREAGVSVIHDSRSAIDHAVLVSLIETVAAQVLPVVTQRRPL